MSKKNPAPPPAEPTREQWEALYEVAGTLKALAPWRTLTESDILVLYLPGQDEPVYCSVMGQGGISYGVSVYPGRESFARLGRLLKQDAYSPELLALEQDCLTFLLGSREDAMAEDRAAMKQLGLRFRGQNQWIFFRAMKPGQFPWVIDAQQAELLTAALQNLAMLCLRYMEGKLSVDFDTGETLARWYDPEKDMWMNAMVPMPEPKIDRALDLQDDLLLARLKRSKKTGTRLEVDSFYLPVPFQEDKHSPPACPHMALLVDKDSGIVLDQHIAAPDEPDFAAAPSMLINYIEEHGRPAAVYVRSDWLGSLLRNICKAVGVRLVEDEGVPALDSLLDELLDSPMMGLGMDDDFE